MFIDKREEDRAAGRFSRGHMAAGILALALSVFVHLFLILILGDIRFWVLSSVSSKVLDFLEERPVKVADVTIEPVQERSDRTPTGTEGPAGETLGEQMDALKPPTRVTTEPPQPAEQWMAGEGGGLAPPVAEPQETTWEPRREILAIEDRKAAEDRLLPRRRISPLDRFLVAPDTVAQLLREDIARTSPLPGGSPLSDPLSMPQGRGGPVLPPPGARTLTIGEPDAEKPEKVLVEDEKLASDRKPLEKYLTVAIRTYETDRDPAYGYFRMEIKRAGAELLPVLPKDIVLVQDCSASMSEQRMYFCRQGLAQCLDELQPGDRFNLMRFSRTADLCFPSWSEQGEESLSQARRFIGELKAEGETDIYGSVRTLLERERHPKRPMITMIVSDGRPTTGLTRSSDIIGDFSSANNGAVSVFTFGTLQTANTYLLDLLSYCNRGNTHIVTSGRWGIAEEMVQLMKGLSRPVLSNVRFTFASGSGNDVFPVLTENLYMDQPIVLFGRYPRRNDRIIFQATGDGLDLRCDMIFDESLARAQHTEDREIRTDWARQKIYHLIGQNARRPAPATISEILSTAREYRIDVPYKRQF